MGDEERSALDDIAPSALPGRSMVATAVSRRLLELARQLNELNERGLVEWEHLEALSNQLNEVRTSLAQAKQTFGWADYLQGDGKGRKTLAEIAAATEEAL